MLDPKFARLIAAENALVDSTVTEPMTDSDAALFTELGDLIALRQALIAADALTPAATNILKQLQGDLALRMRAAGWKGAGAT